MRASHMPEFRSQNYARQLLAWAAQMLVFILLAMCTSPAQKPSAANRLRDMSHLLGDWQCQGKFMRSGSPIEATVRFEEILDGAFVLFRHDDKPPHSYHAWSQWGWNNTRSEFVSVVEDSSGGLRLFRSPGWEGSVLRWEGGALPESHDERFDFERLNANSFRVTYLFHKEAWTAVDSSVCTK